MKKSLSILLSLLMIVSTLTVLPFLAFADTEGNYTYSVKDDKSTITGYNGTESVLKIPATLGDKPVVAIGDSVFDAKTTLTKVVIPEGVTTIGDSAFYDCENLVRVDIPVSVTKIGAWAFKGCKSLKRAFINGTVSVIDESTFKGCESLTAVSFPSSLDAIGEDVFKDCVNLKEVYYTASIGNYNDDVTISESNTCLFGANFNEYCAAGNCGDDVYYICNIENGVLTLKGTGATDNYFCDYPGFYAYRDDIAVIDIGEGITVIDEGTFFNLSKAVMVMFPNTLTEIGESAFTKCTSLKGITIPRSVKNIKKFAFAECDALTKVNVYSYYVNIEAMFAADTTIYACDGSTAEAYAKKYGYEFIAIGHHWDEWDRLEEETEPTCTVPGTTILYIHECTICGAYETQGGYYIAPYGHALNEGVITKYPTPTEKGLVEFTCEECGEKVTKSVAKCDKYANPLTVNVKKPAVKLSKLKKKNQTIALKSWATVSKAQGKVTYAKVSGSKKITIAKNGKITVKKGLKKGSYKVKVKITAAGNATYKPITKTVTVTIKINK